MKTGAMRPQAKEVLDIQGEVWGRLFPKPAEVAWLCHHFDFRLSVSKNTMYLCCPEPQFAARCCGSPKKQICV